MGLTVSFIFSWMAILLGFVLAWQLLTKDLKESGFIELMASPFLFSGLKRSLKFEEKVATGCVIFFIGCLVQLLSSYWIFLQKLWLTPSNGILILQSKNDIEFISVFLALMAGLLFVVSVGRLTKPIPAKNWKKQPMLWQMKRKEYRLKYIFLLVMIFFQIILYSKMKDYVIVNNQNIFYSDFFSKSKQIPLSDIVATLKYKKLNITKEVKGTNLYRIVPEFSILINQHPIDIYDWRSTDKNQISSLIEVAKNIKKNNGQVFVHFPSILDYGRIKKLYSTENIYSYDHFFNEVDLISTGVTGQLKIGDIAFINETEIQINKFSCKGKSDKNLCSVNLSIKNHAADTLNVAGLLNFKLIDNKGKEFSQILFYPESFPINIPPKELQVGDISFSTTTKDSLSFRYKPSLLENRFISFKLY